VPSMPAHVHTQYPGYTLPDLASLKLGHSPHHLPSGGSHAHSTTLAMAEITPYTGVLSEVIKSAPSLPPGVVGSGGLVCPNSGEPRPHPPATSSQNPEWKSGREAQRPPAPAVVALLGEQHRRWHPVSFRLPNQSPTRDHDHPRWPTAAGTPGPAPCREHTTRGEDQQPRTSHPRASGAATTHPNQTH
jgi:hypothetical protein